MIQSQKDAAVRKLLQEHYSFNVISTFTREFKCTPRTAIIKITHQTNSQIEEDNKILNLSPKYDLIRISLVRGKLSNTIVQHNDNKGAFSFIHTVDLKNEIVQVTRKKTSTHQCDIIGPAVLLPRVGKPSLNKIVFLRAGARAVLSDCVLGIECSSFEDASQVHSRLVSFWDQVEKLYGGTCALYITLANLISFITQIGCPPLPYGQSIRENEERITTEVEYCLIATA